MNRRDATFALLALGLAPRTAFAQQAGKVWRIGYLASESADANPTRLKALRDSLRELGYVEGRNLVIERRQAEGKYARLPGLAQELVSLKVDVIVSSGDKASVAAAGATKAIPVVVGLSSDLVALGLIDSLARPGGNVTGWSGMGAELQAKRLALLKETAPQITRVAALMNPGNAIAAPMLRAMRAAATALKLELLPVEAGNLKAIDAALSAIAQQRAEALVVQPDTLFYASEDRITQFAAQQRLSSAGRYRYALNGGLLGYGSAVGESFSRAAGLVDRIFRGAKPADLPAEQPTRFELVVNRKTAVALGLRIPQSILLRADKVIG